MATVLITAAAQAALATAVSFGLSFIKKALIGDQVSRNQAEGPRLSGSQVTTAAEGQSVSRHWGRNRLAGNIIWATRFKETKSTETSSTTTETGGKGGGGSTSTTTTETTVYSYTVSFAVAFCEGHDRVKLGRVWADGKLLVLSDQTYRFYKGAEDQIADPLIQSVEDDALVSAYRGVCYLVFEDMDIEPYGNRVPQITAEIIKGSRDVTINDLESLLKGVALIPASGEFAYGTREYVSSNNSSYVTTPHGTRDNPYSTETSTSVLAGTGDSTSINVHNSQGIADLLVSLDDLEDSASGVSTILLVVSWFGDDLRIGHCTLQPRCEGKVAQTIIPEDWKVSGLTRSTANSVSLDSEDNFNYGGTPADVTIRECILELKDRGFRVVFYPFILMDIVPGNTLPDPYSDNASASGQPVFPWRGRLTASPAPGYTGSVDQTAAAASQVADFVGTASPSDFGSWSGGTIPYSGPNEFSYRRMILHYARLCSDVFDAGDVFIIGSELRGLSQTRDGATSYPFVDELVTLAGDVTGMLGAGRLVSYAADWSEYHSHRPDGNTINFHLDPLWASSNIDFVGIDNYLPMSDWRDGNTHLDADAGYKSIYSSDYLQDNVEGGEYYDWYYVTDSDRDGQVRTDITDGLGKPWVYRNKDIRNWWANSHYNRAGGAEALSKTAWSAESKPIWFTEFGCAAVDKATNQPNVFVDPKSSESFYPYYSNKNPDDLIQRRYIEETLKYWRDHSPTSSVYSDKMIKSENMLAWTWDARPYPEFPFHSNIWTDSQNYRLGHWLNGRTSMITLATLVSEISELAGLTQSDIDVSELYGPDTSVRGFTIDDLSSSRGMIESLMNVFHFDAFISEGILKFSLKIYPDALVVDLDDFVSTDDNPGGYSLTRTNDVELPAVAKITFYDEANDYQAATVDAQKQTGNSENVVSGSAPVVISEHQARGVPYRQLAEAWSAREHGKVALPPSLLALDPGDVLAVSIKDRPLSLRIDGFDSGEFREASVHGFDVANYGGLSFPIQETPIEITPFYGPSVVDFVDLPMLSDTTPIPHAPRVYGYQNPWPGRISIFEDDNSGGWALNTSLHNRAVIGRSASDFSSGTTYLWDKKNELLVDVFSSDQILGTTDLAVLNGANLAAIENDEGDWEVFQFVNASLENTRRYRLSRLLRGQGGTERAMRDPVSSGARIIFLSLSAAVPLGVSQSEIFQDKELRYGPGRLDVGNFRYQQEIVNIGAVGLRPYSPVHLKGELNNDDWYLSWVRRTRFGGDSWAPASVPLNEDIEAYEIDILDGSVVVRTVEVYSTDFVYDSAMQIVDFGSNQTGLSIRIYQMSVLYGRGEVSEAVF